MPHEPLAIRGIDHVLLLVRDLDRAIEFYERVAGCTVTSRIPRYAMVELRAGASQIDLVDVSAPEGAWAKPPVEGDGVSFYVRDPSGNAIELRSA